jgi:hypothetical protein
MGKVALCLYPSGRNKPRDGALQRLPAAIDQCGKICLAAGFAPTKLVAVAAEQAEHLQVAALQSGISNRAGWND